MNACFLGTASGLPAADRFGQTTVLSFETPDGRPRHILLDAGDGASSLLFRHGYDHLDIEVIVISHMHADHHGGFAQVVKTCMHLNRRDDLVIAAPAEGIDALRAYLDASYLYEPLLGFTIDWRRLPDMVDSPVTLAGGITISTYVNDHLASARKRFAELGWVEHGRTFESYSFVLEDGTSRVIYSGNLNGRQGADELVEFLEPCDLLICELAHVDPAELGRILSGRDVRQVALAHFHPKWDGVSNDDILARIHEGAGGIERVGEITLATDGQEVSCVAVPGLAAR